MTRSMKRRQVPLAAFCLAVAAIVGAQDARAAGAAYQVDTSEVSEAGNCKVESWASFASNQDFFAAVAPTCAFELGKPFELGAQLSRSRADGDWVSTLTPKAKIKLLPSGIGTFGLAVTATAAFDLVTRENTAITFAIPATMRLSEDTRINVNLGWLLDRTTDQHYLTYGLGFDWRTPDNVHTLTAEVFGQIGSAETQGVTQPRFQLGYRYRPVDRFNIDFIYGRNLGGENAHWFTVATVIRFPPPGK